MKLKFPRVAAPVAAPNATDASGLAPPEPQAVMSAMADGDASAVQYAGAQWRDDAQARERWHTYHLIGDVMRSDELATQPAHDADFLAALRGRLAAEPVVLAPAELVRADSAVRRRSVWLMPVAAAAGFVVVAGVLVVARVGMPGASVDSPQLAGVQQRQSGSVQRVSGNAAGEGGGRVVGSAPMLVRSEGVIRDARLDEYLRAHQAARGGVAVAQPGGTVRRMDAAVPVSVER